MAVLSAFQLFDVSPQSFSAMRPHDRSLAVRLCLERGVSASEIRRALDISGRALADLASERHLYNLPVVHESPEEKPVTGSNGRPPAVSTKVLRLIADADDGALMISRQAMSEACGCLLASVDSAITRMREMGLIERLHVPRTGKPSEWKITSAGLAQLKIWEGLK